MKPIAHKISRLTPLIRWAAVTLAFMGIAWFIGYRRIGIPPQPRVSQSIRTGGYEYINPLLLCNGRQEDESVEFSALNHRLQTFIDREISQRHVNRMSIVIRDLNNGRWVGVNEQDRYSPASLLKVPIMMAYLEKAQDDPSLLSRTYTYAGSAEAESAEFFKSAVSLEKGKNYTAEQLISDMIIHSSNGAKDTLRDHMDDQHLRDFYTLMGIRLPADDASEDFLSPVSFAQFFRVLYNGTYLSRAYSEKALNILAKTDFADGLTKYLPSTTVVAHKFGERSMVAENDPLKIDKREVHDCGIVYLPDHPYLICVMTEGTSFPDLTEAIAQISKIAYDDFSLIKP